jgi:hypothetical protein
MSHMHSVRGGYVPFHLLRLLHYSCDPRYGGEDILFKRQRQREVEFHYHVPSEDTLLEGQLIRTEHISWRPGLQSTVFASLIVDALSQLVALSNDFVSAEVDDAREEGAFLHNPASFDKGESLSLVGFDVDVLGILAGEDVDASFELWV